MQTPYKHRPQVRDLRAAEGGRTVAGKEPTLEREGFVLKRFYDELGGQEGGITGNFNTTVDVTSYFFGH